MDGKEIIRVEGINKNFTSTKALSDVSIEVSAGEIRGLIGENGSGKSTLASIISGAYKSDSGLMYYLGQPHNPQSLIEARNMGICILVQEQGTIDGMTIAENVFLGQEGIFSKVGNVNRKKMCQETLKILSKLNIFNINPNAFVEELSFEDRKLIEVAAAVYRDPKLLIVDETTTALSQKGREIVYSIMKERKAQGNAVIFISHDLAELNEICDSITVLRDGKLISTLNRNQIEVNTLKTLMIGRTLTEHYYRIDTEASFETEVAFTVSGISYKDILHDVSLEMHKGEIFGIGGLTECGMHELCKIMFGAIKPEKGSVTVKKSGATITSPLKALREGVAYIPKDRDKESAFLGTSIADNIVMASLDKIKKGFYISRKKERYLACDLAEKTNIKMRDINQFVKELSGGNKQKVVLAKWMANDSDILIMDCPTRGIDVGVKTAIYRLMEEFKAKGKTVIMVSEELPELIGMSDRIAILKDGVITEIFSRSNMPSEHMLIQKMI